MEEIEAVPNLQPPSTKAKDQRNEMLQRWKEEKQLKAKLKSEKLEKPFKVTKINYTQPIFLFSKNQVNGKPITTAAANAMNATMRITRSKMDTSTIPKAQPEKRVAPVKKLRSTKPQPPPVVEARKVSKMVKGIVKSAAPKPQPCHPTTSSAELPNAEGAPRNREPSFAPLQFAFTAPSVLSPFFFEPSSTIRVEKLIQPLTVLSSVSSVEKRTPSSSDDKLNNKEIDGSFPNAENEAVFKTPRSAAPKCNPLKISPLLENNPWICTTRGRPPSSKKSTPRRSRLSEGLLAPCAIRFEIQPKESENLAETMQSESTATIAPSNVDVSNNSSPPRQVQAESPASNAVSRNSSGLPLTTAYFRNLLVDHTKELKALCNTWQTVMESEQQRMSENVTGKIRTTIGQSELLMAERFKQFSGLIDDCEFVRGEKVTTCVDLQGFWEMIFFQVEDVKAKFEFLQEIKDGNWEDIATPLKKPAAVVRRNVRRGPRPNKGAAAQAARKRLAEAKAKAAQQRKVADNEQCDDLIVEDGENSHISTQKRVQEITAEGAFPSVQNGTSRRRRSLRSSFQAVDVSPNEQNSALLLPVPVLESLSVNSPAVVNQGLNKRLSELFSPLSMGKKNNARMLDTIHDDEDSELKTHEQVDVTSKKPHKSIATPSRRFTRSSNLIRFSSKFLPSDDPAAAEQENANLNVTLN